VSVSRLENEGNLISLTRTFRNVKVGCRVPAGRLVCSHGNVRGLDEE
jgi:hypothetical protein